MTNSNLAVLKLHARSLEKISHLFIQRRIERAAMEDRARALFAFGIVADVQYADIDDGLNYLRTRRRFYRHSLELLRNATRHWEERRVRCVLQLGDVIDGYNKSRDASDHALDTVVKEFEKCSVDVHHVWGNHEFYNFRRETLLASPLNSSAAKAETGSDLLADDIYAYDFSPAPNFRFVLLDAYDMSVIGREEGSEKHQQSLKLLQQHNNNPDLNQPPVFGLEQRFVKFNGGFSQEQLVWLDEVLTLADQKQEKVTVFSHLPVHPDATDSICLAWNYEALLSVLRSHKSVVCFMAGHDHDGGYCTDASGVHHVTLEGVIETRPDSNAFGTVYVYEDRMLLKGSGRTSDRVLKYP